MLDTTTWEPRNEVAVDAAVVETVAEVTFATAAEPVKRLSAGKSTLASTETSILAEEFSL